MLPMVRMRIRGSEHRRSKAKRSVEQRGRAAQVRDHVRGQIEGALYDSAAFAGLVRGSLRYRRVVL